MEHQRRKRGFPRSTLQPKPPRATQLPPAAPSVLGTPRVPHQSPSQSGLPAANPKTLPHGSAQGACTSRDGGRTRVCGLPLQSPKTCQSGLAQRSNVQSQVSAHCESCTQQKVPPWINPLRRAPVPERFDDPRGAKLTAEESWNLALAREQSIFDCHATSTRQDHRCMADGTVTTPMDWLTLPAHGSLHENAQGGLLSTPPLKCTATSGLEFCHCA